MKPIDAGALPAVPMIDLASQYAPLRDEILAAITRIVDSGRFILGPEVEALENEIAAMHGVEHAVGVASGTDALMLVWRAIGVGPGDEVIVPALTFLASGSSVALAGGVPVFADVKSDTLNLDPAAAEAAITPRTKAILAVHLYGQSADVVALKKIADAHGLVLIEDCAQAIGATWDGAPVGSTGLAGTTSFYPSKNLGAPGEGGMIWTPDAELAAKLRRLRNHGEGRRYEHVELGTNSRLPAIAGAVLRIKLRVLPEWTRKRRANAAFYDRLFSELAPVVRPVVTDPKALHVYHQYTIVAADRDSLREHLTSRRIENIVYYPIPLHLQPCFAKLGGRPDQFPAAEKACAEIVSIPVHSELAEAERVRVVEAVGEWARSQGGAATDPSGGAAHASGDVTPSAAQSGGPAHAPAAKVTPAAAATERRS